MDRTWTSWRRHATDCRVSVGSRLPDIRGRDRFGLNKPHPDDVNPVPDTDHPSQSTKSPSISNTEENRCDDFNGAMSAAPARGTGAQRPRRPHHKRHRRVPEPTEPPDPDEPEEKRPKVNPIFLWASQQEQRIVEVRCEDYDKRNRIKLTKTPQGWRSIPRTTVVPVPSTPAPLNSAGERVHRHRGHRRHHRHSQHDTTRSDNEPRRTGVDRRLLLLQPRVILQQLRPSQLPASTTAVSAAGDPEDSRGDIIEILDTTTASPAMAADTLTADLPDSRETQVPICAPCFTDPDSAEETQADEWSSSLASSDSIVESDTNATSSSRILDALRKTPGLSVSIASPATATTSTVQVDNNNSTEVEQSAPPRSPRSPISAWQKRPTPSGLLMSIPGTEVDNRDGIRPALMSGLSISIPRYRYRPRSEGNISSLKVNSDSSESPLYPKVEAEDLEDSRSQGTVVQASPQPSGIPCSPAAGGRPASAYLERLLPSPPCSVSCSEDATRNDLTLKGILASPSHHLRQSQHQAMPETNNNKTDPASELRELLRVSGRLIPDPLLVPRDFLPALAAAPAVEIPRLLKSRPELRLPQALTRPELLRDPDLLVISLAHLQHVLDHGEGPVSVDRPRPKLSCKPIGTLMPAPIDLSASRTRQSTTNSYPLLRVKTTGLLKQEPEVTSTAASPEDSQLWHPLFSR